MFKSTRIFSLAFLSFLLILISTTSYAQAPVCPVPTAVLTGTTAICKGGLATLQFEMTGRLPYTVVFSDGTSQTILTNLASCHFLTVEPEVTTTYSLVSVTDANGCSEADLPGEVVISVEDAVAQFALNSASEGCSPLNIEFINGSIQEGVTYEWSWGDGSPNTITSDAVVSHEFQNNSITSTLTYNVTLFARNDALGCLDTYSETIEVFPSIFTSLVAST